MNNEVLLNNPAWSALTTEQSFFARGNEAFKRYQPGILSFAACADPGNSDPARLDEWLEAGESFYMIGELPAIPGNWKVEFTLPCFQMVLTTLNRNARSGDAPIRILGEADGEEMYELINSLQPGYYLKDTRQLGTYMGIHDNGKLVAMAGERMRMSGFTELSAICTHPSYTGKGYAQQLIIALCEQHKAAGITSFLHVSAANERAVSLYEYMGFRKRTSINFTKLKRI
ncbi:ribosomal protein S18 acetylase RimI-like enzyme [Chitinophaga terrae (ex Kim and Jung 2007)]|uniref:GNAT family N-acetyltransferase n=1 Tax=Chitinophaga terrae (ex Kim and Jung 2007) TaxID=408074 RepID=UPI00277E19CF|nr:GNAT family N-acetyltransferase [Chitinophaga terrae (ex Kim and Jung 2007)]MDQ0106202.1 ribosomal protein S18 acetylase RimI-like enzyme [Chitinophaga terrae (ex Kim and Jung 2007)]